MPGEVSSTTSGSSLPNSFPELSALQWLSQVMEQIPVELRVSGCLCVVYAVCVWVCVCVFLPLCDFTSVRKNQSRNSEGVFIASKRSRSRVHDNAGLLRQLYYKPNLKVFPQTLFKTGPGGLKPYKVSQQVWCTLRLLKAAHTLHTPPSSFVMSEKTLFHFYPFPAQEAWVKLVPSNCTQISEFRGKEKNFKIKNKEKRWVRDR